MTRNPQTGATMERLDARWWEFRIGGRSFWVEMEPDGPFKRRISMPDTKGDPALAAAAEWAMGVVRAEMARTGTEVVFGPAAPA